jgi:hypothetical protein
MDLVEDIGFNSKQLTFILEHGYLVSFTTFEFD